MVAHLHYSLSLYVLKNSEETGQAVADEIEACLCVCASSKQKGRCGDWKAEGAEE